MFTKHYFLGTIERTACTRQRMYFLHVTFTFTAVCFLVTFENHYISIHRAKVNRYLVDTASGIVQLTSSTSSISLSISDFIIRMEFLYRITDHLDNGTYIL